MKKPSFKWTEAVVDYKDEASANKDKTSYREAGWQVHESYQNDGYYTVWYRKGAKNYII